VPSLPRDAAAVVISHPVEQKAEHAR